MNSASWITFISNVTGTALTEKPDADYWLRHTFNPVRFSDSMKTLAADNNRIFLEIGPHPVLANMASQCLEEESNCVFIPTMTRGREIAESLPEALAELYSAGVDIDWSKVHEGRNLQKIKLPHHP